MTVSQADFDALKAKVADMAAAMGDWNQPQLSRAEMEKQRADGTVLQLPNGDNPLFWSTRWGRFAIDDATGLVGKFDKRLKAVEAGGGGGSTTLPDSIQTDALGRIGIGGPPLVDDRTGKPVPAVGLTIHCIKGGTAAIAFVGNETLDHPQRQTAANPNGDPQRKQITVLAGQGDGYRILWNCVYGEDGEWVPDEFRPKVQRSIDSMGDLCDQSDLPGTSDGGQNWYTWLRGRQGQEGNVVHGSPQPGAKIVFLQTKAGSVVNAFDEVLVPVPLSEWQQMKARLSALDGK